MEREGRKGIKLQEEEMIAGYKELIRENIAYEEKMATLPVEKKLAYDMLYQVMCDVVCRKRGTIKIVGVSCRIW